MSPVGLANTVTNHFRGISGIYLKSINKYRNMPTCNQLDLENPGVVTDHA